ncbi:MAG TPA: aminoacyl-tRNA deacylase [Anaerolineales bacterium]|nr:aminoacyl-tRNA deacylase [Anaerolineales bacterium]
MTTRNNVTRLLDSKKIPYEVFELSTDEKTSALETAARLGIPPEMVFKTIVVTRTVKGKPILAVVPAPSEVDLKLVAKAVNEKKVALPTQREAEQLTGLQAGGISPLALINKGFQMLLDQSAANFPEIHISGGQRGLNIRLPVYALLQLTNGKLADIKTNE